MTMPSEIRWSTEEKCPPPSPSTSQGSEDFLLPIENEESETRHHHILNRLRRATTILWNFTNPQALFTNSTTPAHPSRTASYDGLRGIACLIIFNFHFLYPYTKTITHGYAAASPNDTEPNPSYPHQLPLLALLVRGRAMVTLFFAISGYVLSHNHLSHSLPTTATSPPHPTHTAFTTLSSLALRRYARLYFPATISMLLVLCGASLGAFDAGRRFQATSPWLTGTREQHPPRFARFADQVRDFADMWWEWQTPFSWSLMYNEYDPHTWAIPVEFRASMVVLIVLLATARLRRYVRLAGLGVVTGYCLASRRWDVAAFMGGAVGAGMHLLEEECMRQRLPEHSVLVSAHLERAKRFLSTAAKTALLLAALYLLSYPDDKPDRTAGYRLLYTLTPPIYTSDDPHSYLFWHSFASIFIIWCLPRLSLVQSFCCLSYPQYLGKISYAFYLVHGPLLHSAGFALQPRLFGLMREGNMANWVGCLLLGWMVMLAVSIAVAHAFWQVVDVALVRVVKWAERQLLSED